MFSLFKKKIRYLVTYPGYAALAGGSHFNITEGLSGFTSDVRFWIGPGVRAVCMPRYKTYCAMQPVQIVTYIREICCSESSWKYFSCCEAHTPDRRSWLRSQFGGVIKYKVRLVLCNVSIWLSWGLISCLGLQSKTSMWLLYKRLMLWTWKVLYTTSKM